MTALCFARRTMETPVRNMVELVDLSPNDALLPIIECVSNSIISLSQSNLPVKKREIDVEIVRGKPLPQAKMFGGETRPIKDFIVTDNGVGFNEQNFQSFKTPHSNILRKNYGCLGVGRFSVLAAFEQMKIRSNFPVNGGWEYREFDFDVDKEVKSIIHRKSEDKKSKTVVEIQGLYNETLVESTVVSIEEIAREVMKHFLIFYLSKNLPRITVLESGTSNKKVVNDLYEEVSKDAEAAFTVQGQTFRIYRVRSPRTSNRRHHYVHYCADSRTVGRGKNLVRIDSIFNYPLSDSSSGSYLDVYVVGDYLNKKKVPSRNAFNIPNTRDERLQEEISFEDIELELAKILRREYADFVKQAQLHSVEDWKRFIAARPRFSSLLSDEDLLKQLPANIPDDQKEEHLYRIIHKRRKTAEARIQTFIQTKPVTEQTIQEMVGELKSKTELDRDSLADYMLRRKVVIDLLDKFLDADRKGEYRLESDVHNLIYPMGQTNSDTAYDAHNLWLLDERLVAYKFIASDKQIRTYSNINSRKAADIATFDLFDNPISYGDAAQGDISSLVIFEFKRPGDVASTMRKDGRWEFSELTDKYFEDFLYGKKNYKGREVNVRTETRKFGYIILSAIPKALEDYNLSKDWKKSPFNSFYKMVSGNNLHIEAMTFDTLIAAARQRHNPFFDRLFIA